MGLRDPQGVRSLGRDLAACPKKGAAPVRFINNLWKHFCLPKGCEPFFGQGFQKVLSSVLGLGQINRKPRRADAGRDAQLPHVHWARANPYRVPERAI